MQARHGINKTNLDLDSTDTKQVLCVVVVYSDIASGKRAIRTIASLGKGLGDEIGFQVLPWSFDLLADLDWCKRAATDVVKADILIIATSSANPLPSTVERWANGAISQKRGSAAAVVALFGSEENPDGAGSSRLEAMQTAARRAGLDFFAPAPCDELDETINRIHQRAEMVTPILSEILHYRHPAPSWNQHP